MTEAFLYLPSNGPPMTDRAAWDQVPSTTGPIGASHDRPVGSMTEQLDRSSSAIVQPLSDHLSTSLPLFAPPEPAPRSAEEANPEHPISVHIASPYLSAARLSNSAQGSVRSATADRTTASKAPTGVESSVISR